MDKINLFFFFLRGLAHELGLSSIDERFHKNWPDISVVEAVE